MNNLKMELAEYLLAAYRRLGTLGEVTGEGKFFLDHDVDLYFNSFLSVRPSISAGRSGR